MKTQISGISDTPFYFSYFVGVTGESAHNPYVALCRGMRKEERDELGVSVWLSIEECLQNYRKNRENGRKMDNPPREFPNDGIYSWETPNASFSKICYTQGPRDAAWMAEKDRNYLARLERGAKNKTHKKQQVKEKQEKKLHQKTEEKDSQAKVKREHKESHKLWCEPLKKETPSCEHKILSQMKKQNDVKSTEQDQKPTNDSEIAKQTLTSLHMTTHSTSSSSFWSQSSQAPSSSSSSSSTSSVPIKTMMATSSSYSEDNNKNTAGSSSTQMRQ